MAVKSRSSREMSPAQRMGRAYKVFTDSLFRPICVFLSDRGVSPDSISDLRCFLGVAGIILFSIGFKWPGVSLFILSLVMDSIDGGIARYLKIGTDRGTFIDKIADYTIYCASVISMVFLEEVGGFAGSYHIAVVFAAIILKVVAENEGKKTDWLIDPAPNLVWFMIIWYGSLFIFLFTGVNWMAGALFWLNVFLTLSAIQSFLTIQSRWSRMAKRGR